MYNKIKFYVVEKKKWFISLLLCVVVLAVGIGGMSLAVNFKNDLLEKENSYNKRKFINQQRLSLLVELSRVASSMEKMKSYNEYLEHQLDIMDICKYSKQNNCLSQDDPRMVSEIKFKIIELNTDYKTVLKLIKIFFSISVYSDLDALAAEKEWWLPEVESKFQALLTKMAIEIEED